MRHAIVSVFVLLFVLVPAAAAGDIVVGADAGGGPQVNVFDGTTIQPLASFFAYDAAFSGGVRVAKGDVNGDGVQDIVTGAGAGGGPHVKVFDGVSGQEIRSFFAFDPGSQGFIGGVWVAAGDVDGDGFADIIVGAGAGGGPHVRVFSGATGALSYELFFDTYEKGDIRVAAGDVNGDGRPDVIVGGGPGTAPQIQVIDGKTRKLIRSFAPFASAFTGGVTVAGADVNGDGYADIIVGAGAGGGPHVQVFSGKTLETLSSFDAYAPTFTGGVRVAAADVNGDGRADIITGTGAGGGPHVKAFDGKSLAELDSFFAFTPGFLGGVFVAGGPKGATDRIPDLHGLVTSFRLDKGLDAFFQNRITAAQNTLGKYVTPCDSLDSIVQGSLAKAGKTRGMLTTTQAQRLLGETNGILIGLLCMPASSPFPGGENDLIGLLDTIDRAGLSNGEEGILIGLLRKDGIAMSHGDEAGTCRGLIGLRSKMQSDAADGKISTAILIGLLLPAVQKVQNHFPSCSVGGTF